MSIKEFKFYSKNLQSKDSRQLLIRYLIKMSNIDLEHYGKLLNDRLYFFKSKRLKYIFIPLKFSFIINSNSLKINFNNILLNNLELIFMHGPGPAERYWQIKVILPEHFIQQFLCRVLVKHLLALFYQLSNTDYNVQDDTIAPLRTDNITLYKNNSKLFNLTSKIFKNTFINKILSKIKNNWALQYALIFSEHVNSIELISYILDKHNIRRLDSNDDIHTILIVKKYMIDDLLFYLGDYKGKLYISRPYKCALDLTENYAALYNKKTANTKFNIKNTPTSIYNYSDNLFKKAAKNNNIYFDFPINKIFLTVIYFNFKFNNQLAILLPIKSISSRD